MIYVIEIAQMSKSLATRHFRDIERNGFTQPIKVFGLGYYFRAFSKSVDLTRQKGMCL